MRHPLLLICTLVLVAALAAGAYLLSRDEAPIRASLTVAEAMASDTVGYARAQAVRPFHFPEDYGPHPDYKSEWWYFTGNLVAETGRRFGYELTLFRFALVPPGEAVRRASDWAADQLYMGHFAVTDVEGERFYPFERFSRGAAGLAGARSEPFSDENLRFRVWLEDWSIEAAEDGLPAMHLQAGEEEAAVDLVLRPVKPLVLQGDRGYDRKGPKPGDASYYYSFTRLAAEGTVTVGGESYAVEGLSWMDREWSTSALGADQVGWDWFALQLSDGQDLMYYQIRERGGGVSPQSDGILVDAAGGTRPLAPGDVQIEVLRRWESPQSGAVYPAGWRLRIPSEDTELTVLPYLDGQEMDLSVRYWEGAVRVEGTAAGAPVTGSGYVELTGYEGEGPGGEGQKEGLSFR